VLHPAKPRILFISPIEPATGGNGLAMRAGMFLEAMASVGIVDLAVLPVAGTTAEGGALADRLGVRSRSIPVTGRSDTHFSLVRRIKDRNERLAAFRAYGRPSLTAFLSMPVLSDFARHFGGQEYDLIHIARSYLMPVLAVWAGATRRPVISIDLDEDDVKARKSLAAIFRLRGDDARADWEDIEAAAFELLIPRWLGFARHSYISSSRDANGFAARFGVEPIVVPNAIPIPTAALHNPEASGLLFVGGFGYFANVDGVLWLLEEILPVLAGLTGRLDLTIVGHDPPPRLAHLCHERGVELLTHVADLAPIYARSALAVVPLRVGAGTRIKVLEAAARRVPVVTTRLGSEGLDLTDGSDVWLADDAVAFARACAAALADPVESRRRAESAFQRAAAKHDRSRVIDQLAREIADRIASAPLDAANQPRNP
jgi:glycosyltransferase involved in cell wall biosynthesis